MMLEKGAHKNTVTFALGAKYNKKKDWNYNNIYCETIKYELSIEWNY